MALNRFQTLIFDLDDTLIPTSELLIPRAVRHVFQLLSENGLKWSFNQFEEYRKKHIELFSHREILEKLLNETKLGTKEHILQDCLRAFYEASIPSKIPLLPGALENLSQLTKTYRLLLLTAGDQKTQKQKIINCDIEKYFSEIIVADSSWQFNKQLVIENWIKSQTLSAHNTLSIGNRLKDEIRASKILGLSTCHFKYGEHAHENPKDHYEMPDFNVENHLELVTKCKL